MLQLMLAAREDETETAQIPHKHSKTITEGLNNDEIVANITHFIMAGKLIITNWTSYKY